MIEKHFTDFKSSRYNTSGKDIVYDKDLIELIIEQNNIIIAQNIELLQYIKSK